MRAGQRFGEGRRHRLIPTDIPEAEFFDVFHDLAASGRAQVRTGFGGWVPEVYDLMEGDFEDDIPLILELAEETGGPIVDLGSGTGRLTLPLLREGFEVFAVDSDAGMHRCLQSAAERLSPAERGRLHMVDADIRSFELPTPAQLAVCSTNTFLYLGSLAEQRTALRNIRRSLAPGGALWLDVFVPKPNPSSQEPYLTSRHDPDTGLLLLYAAQQRDDHFEGRSLVNAWTIVFGRQPEPEMYVQGWSYAWLYPNELRLLLEAEGFVVEQLLGDYDGGPADDIAVQMIAIARAGE